MEWNVFIVFFPLFATYGILRYRLLGFEPIVQKSLVYTALVSISTVIYLTIVMCLGYFFQRSLGVQSIIPVVISIALIILLAEPLRVQIQRFIDKIFYKSSLVDMAKEKSRLQEEVERQAHMKVVATLAAGMAHEIKNPLHN